MKALAAGPNDSIITGSRDNRAILFARDQTANKVVYAPSTVVSHTNFVNAVAFVPPSQLYPEGKGSFFFLLSSCPFFLQLLLWIGLLVSGGRENIIYAHAPSNPAVPVYTMIGHTENICSLAIAGTPEAPLILSGSWDKSCRVWAHGQCVQVLEGHEAAVWSVIALENGDILSGKTLFDRISVGELLVLKNQFDDVFNRICRQDRKVVA